MPHKVWAIGEEVLAADMNAYVQEQVVGTFANAAARDAAITAPKAGMVSYLADTRRYSAHDGIAWAGLPGSRIASAAVAAADVANGAVNTQLASASFTLASQRLVMIVGQTQYSIVTGPANGNISVGIGADGDYTNRFAACHNVGVGSVWGGAGVIFAVLAAGAHTARIAGSNASTTACAARFVANVGAVNVIDLGGA